jgi:hypothetical protein
MIFRWRCPVGAAPSRRQGRKKRKALKDRVDEAKRRGKRVEIAWHGGERKLVCLLSGVCLWYVSGLPPVPIRWVLVVDPSGKSRPEAFFSTDRTMTPQQIMEGFVLRWNVEVLPLPTIGHNVPSSAARRRSVCWSVLFGGFLFGTWISTALIARALFAS